MIDFSEEMLLTSSGLDGIFFMMGGHCKAENLLPYAWYRKLSFLSFSAPRCQRRERNLIATKSENSAPNYRKKNDRSLMLFLQTSFGTQLICVTWIQGRIGTGLYFSKLEFLSRHIGLRKNVKKILVYLSCFLLGMNSRNSWNVDRI